MSCGALEQLDGATGNVSSVGILTHCDVRVE